ncbi:DUF5808 domain-containing protein [Paenibacillus sp. GCM10027627]|uniref:DUF5808 domain-containing protein n=1 Tax=unclassified Paenibacillus TaxID=185978 RepID=UPI003632CEF4
MNNWILFIPSIMAYIAILAQYWRQSDARGGIWFGVTLPKEAMADKRLAALRAEYRKSYLWYGAFALAALLPMLWMGEFVALALFYFLLWLIMLIYTSTVPFKRIHHKTVKLKREQGWFVGEKRYVSIEKELAHYMAMWPWSPYWFAVPALLCVPFIVLSIQNGSPLLRLTGIAALLMTGVTLLISLTFTHGKPRAYSRNPVPNEAIRNAARWYWSIFWLLLAIFEVINAFIAYRLLSEGTMINANLWLGGIAMVSVVPMLGIYFVHNRIRDLEYRYGGTDGKGYYADNDLHWRHGLHYFNPADTSIMVPKRVGIGRALNMATKGGKAVLAGTIVFAAAVTIPAAAMIVRADSTPPTMQINGESGIVSIENTEYAISFKREDVLEITLEDTVPTGFRQNGIATSAYARGSFKLTELGPAKLYVFKKAPPFILIKLKEQYVVYNDEDSATTKALYNELKSLTGK